MTLRLIPLNSIPIIKPGDDLAGLIISGLTQTQIALESGDILIIAQKIVSKSEDRFVNLTSVSPSRRAVDLAPQIDKDARLIELVLQESKSIIRFRPGTIIVEHRLGYRSWSEANY